jgi:tetratricopeptide (TPR) repeat protein
MKKEKALSDKSRYTYITLIVFCLGAIFQEVSAQDIESSNIKKVEFLERKDKNTEAEINEMLRITQSISVEQDSLALVHLKRIKTKIENAKYYSAWVKYFELLYSLNQKRGIDSSIDLEMKEIFDKYSEKLTTEELTRIKKIQLNILSNHGKYEDAIKVANDLLLSKNETSALARILYLRGDSYQELGKYADATKDFLKALDAYQSIKDNEGIINVYSGLGNIKRKLNDTIQSLVFYKKALEFAEKQEEIDILIDAYSNVGVGYRNVDSFDLALYYYQKGLDIAERNLVTNSILRINLNMGNVYGDLGDFQEALKRYYVSLQGCKKSANDFGTFLNYKNIGFTYNTIKEYAKAKIFIDSANLYAQKLQLPGEIAGVYLEYSKYFKGIENYKEALDYFQKFYDLKESIINESSKKQVNELQVKYETAIKDKEILKINDALKQKKANTRLLILIIAVLILTASFLIIFLLYRNRLLNQLYLRNVELMKSPQVLSDNYPQNIDSEDSNNEVQLQNKIYQNIIHFLENDKIYTNPYLSIHDLSEKVGCNEKYVSSAISTCSKVNYSYLINSYRINEAKRLIYNNQFESLNEVMASSGFNSRTAFYTAFNKHTGMSPKQFKEKSSASISL